MYKYREHVCVSNDSLYRFVLKPLRTDASCIVLDFWCPLFCDKQFGRRAPDVRRVTSITPVRLRTGIHSRSDKSVEGTSSILRM